MLPDHPHSLTHRCRPTALPVMTAAPALLETAAGPAPALARAQSALLLASAKLRARVTLLPALARQAHPW